MSVVSRALQPLFVVSLVCEMGTVPRQLPVSPGPDILLL